MGELAPSVRASSTEQLASPVDEGASVALQVGTSTPLHQEEARACLILSRDRQRAIRGNCHLMMPVQKTTATNPENTLLTASE